MDTLLKYWEKLQDFLDIRGDVVLLFMSAAVIYNIFKGHDIGPSNAAAYATAVGAFAATKIKSL